MEPIPRACQLAAADFFDPAVQCPTSVGRCTPQTPEDRFGTARVTVGYDVGALIEHPLEPWKVSMLAGWSRAVVARLAASTHVLAELATASDVPSDSHGRSHFSALHDSEDRCSDSPPSPGSFAGGVYAYPQARCELWICGVALLCRACAPRVRQADVAKAGQSSSADNKLSSSSAISCSPRPRSLRCIARFRTALSKGS